MPVQGTNLPLAGLPDRLKIWFPAPHVAKTTLEFPALFVRQRYTAETVVADVLLH
jgi:hypothetical protein